MFLGPLLKSKMFAKLSLPLLLSAVIGINAQTLYLAGDSTMAKGGGGSGTNGWGEYLAQFLTIPVVNNAVGGTSARSYSESGRFTTIINAAKSGDFVIIEFGHNDVTSGAVDNGKQDAVGDDYTTTSTVTTSTGATITIHTYAYYVQNAITALQAKGAIPILSSVTPDNIWTGNAISAGGRFVTYAKSAASRTGITYVDHYDYVAQAYNALGQTTVTTYYPNDHLHTSPAGANVVAQAFLRGLLCGTSTLKSKVNSAGQAVPNGCL